MALDLELLQQLKPRLRGWLHLIAAPLAGFAGLALILLAPAEYRWGVIVYVASTVMLFTASATLHRGNWSPRTTALLRRIDHASIFLLIAGTYTPLTVALLDPAASRTLLLIVWIGALAGVMFRVFWLSAPRWLITPVYAMLGWVAVFFLPDFWSSGGWQVTALLVAGGLCYTVGGVIYALRKPDPNPKWFGFHEVFHSFTLGGYVSHYAAILLAVLGVGALSS